MKFGPNLQRPLFSNKIKKSKKNFLAGNRTLVSRVTGGDTHHYTTEDISSGTLPIGNCIFLMFSICRLLHFGPEAVLMIIVKNFQKLTFKMF